MGSEYILTADGELRHSGIKGMRWGIRRYQNKDGSLTPAGRKRYADETEKLKEREKTIKNQERTKAKLAKLDSKKAELDAREDALKNPGKAKTTDDSPVGKSATKKTSDMSDKELQDRVNRLRNEDAYKDLSKKLGYDTPTTELDVKIAEMEKQKRYLELQRDIKNLTPEKVSLGKKLTSKILNEVVGPAAMSAGKKTLEKYLSESGTAAIEKMLKKEVKQAAEKVTKASEQQAKKEAKKQAKDAEKEAKRGAKETAQKSDNVYEGEIVDDSSSKNKSSSSNKGSKTTIDAEWWSDASSTSVTSLTKTQNSSGRSYVSGYLNTPVLGLPAPKDDD